MKTKYLSSEYKRPICVELEDVKITQTSDIDLGAKTQNCSLTSDSEVVAKRNDEEFAYCVRIARENFVKLLDYVLQFLPPAAMILAQVSLPSHLA